MSPPPPKPQPALPEPQPPRKASPAAAAHASAEPSISTESALPAALRSAARQLLPRAGDLASASLEAELLLAEALGQPRAHLLWLQELLPEVAQRFAALVKERVATGRPVAYLLGRRDFRALSLRVDERVLVPRPETETLVEAFEELLAQRALPDGWVADRGTGSGNIALSVAGPRRVLALDLSAAALEVAAANLTVAERSGQVPAGHVCLLRADSLSAVRRAGLAAVLANPPYIEASDWASLPDDVRLHEPRLALVPSEGSVRNMYTRLIAESWAALAPGGWLLSEVGAGQASWVADVARAAGFAAVQTRRDLAGIERVVLARR
ncbi:MAG: HemK/PrmC family methyltransferase [Planctomycetota bacterium]